MRYLLESSILNFIGALIRWSFGTVWRTIFSRKKFTFQEYLHGPKNPNYYDRFGHEANNTIIAIIFISVVTYLLV